MKIMHVARSIRTLAFLLPIVAIAGCGEGDGPERIPGTPQAAETGVLLDSPVAGVTWQTTNGTIGVTNAQGEFQYLPFENVTFSIGDIVLGTVPGAAIVTAVELTGSFAPTDRAALNMLVFLQSIDEDGDPANGIQVATDAASRTSGLPLDFFSNDFASQVGPAVEAIVGSGRAVVSESAALAHFYETYTELGGAATFGFNFPGFPAVGGGQQVELVFSDDFDGSGSPDSSKWNFETGYGPNNSGWGNNEWQLYTDSLDNVRVEDGNLVIQARCDNPPCGVRDGTVTSARITTQDKFEFKFGIVEARIKPPVGKGSWPAFWSLGAVFPETPWPRAGEIDFMEMFQTGTSDESTTHFTMHWCDETVQAPLPCTFPQGWEFVTQNRSFAPVSLGDDFHVFRAEWTAAGVTGFIDNIPYFELDINPATMEEFLREFFLILNVAMGGTLGSNSAPPAGDEVWPQTMLVDYVRVFQITGGDDGDGGFSVDFEGDPANFNFGPDAGFEGGVSVVVDNPFPEGINTSDQVGRMQKFNGAPFAGSTLMLTTPLSIVQGSTFTMKVYSPRAVAVTFKLEGITNGEVVANHSGSGWEELTFDLSAASGTTTGITLIFDNGTVGDAMNDAANWTFYFDDITLIAPTGGGPGLAQIDLPITFQETDVDYTLTDFGDPVSAMSMLIVDPEDATNFVAQTIKPLGAPVWAGTTMSTPAGFANPIPFTDTQTTIGVRVYSPDAGIPVRLKADTMVGDGAISVETEAMTTVANQWQTLVFDFSNEVAGTAPLDLALSYNALSIFFNFGTDGDTAGEKTYLWDDVEFGVEQDTTAPTLPSVNLVSNNATATLATTGDVVTLAFTADEPITMPTVSIAGSAADEITGGGTSWTATRTLTAGDADGPVAFTIDFADLIGNAGAQVTQTTDGSSVTLDATAPTVAIQGAPASFTTLNPISLTVQFSEDVTGFDVSDVVVTNGVSDPPVSIDASTYTISVDPSGNGDLTVGIRAEAASDAVGIPSEMSADVTILNALSAPPLSVITIASDNTIDAGFAGEGDTVTLSMVAPADIMMPVVTIAGAAADSVSGNGTSWAATRVVQAGDAEGEIGFVINFTYVTGESGPESSITTNGSSVIVDLTGPTVSIEDVPGSIVTADPIAVTFRFDEEVTGFDSSDVTVTNGTIGAASSTDNIVYTANVTPDLNGDLVVAVGADVATDLAGNGNMANSVTAFLPAYSLIWSDDFSGTALNAANWTARTGLDCPDPCDGVQAYVVNRVSVAGGMLMIEAQQAGPSYSSGFIDTKGKLEFRYGRVEVDARMPATVGAAPTLTLLPVDDNYGAWPQSGEIVIADAPDLGGGNVTVEETLHYGLPQPEDTTTTNAYDSPTAPDTATITYALEWEAGEVRWFVDGVHVATQTQDNWYSFSEDADGVYTVGTDAEPFDQDFYLAIGLAVSDSAGGGSTFPQVLQVDEVRVYECANALDPQAGTGCSTGTGVAPIVAPDAPFMATIDGYIDAPAVLDFIDPADPGTPVSSALQASTFNTNGTVNSNPAASDGANTIWNVDVSAPAGNGGVMLAAEDQGSSSGYFDLAGGEAAGELLFRMRVNSAAPATQIEVGLDSPTGSGRQALAVTADGAWRPYSVKLADLAADAVANAGVLDLDGVDNLLVLDVIGGSADLDLDDISVKVTCRDNAGCEATPRLQSIESVYAQSFEGLDMASGAALSGDGWLVFGNVYTGAGAFKFGYGPFGAPNGGPAFSAVASGEGGVDQGVQQLSIYNDYNCCGPGTTNEGHFNGTDLVESLVFQEFTITAGDVGQTWVFQFDAKRGNIGGTTTAEAFLKTLDPSSGFATTNNETVDTTALPTTWNRYELTLVIDAGLVGQLLQVGFSSTASNFGDSGNFYDNITLDAVVR